MINFSTRNFCLLLITSLLSLNFTLAQKATITGNLVDKANNEPLAYANVSIFDEQDNLETGMVTPADGSFQLQVPYGKYTVRIQFVSYKTVNIPVNANKASIALGSINLEEDVNQLAEVEVTARRPQMEMKLDKRVFNVSEDLSNIGGSAESILDNLPSVTVDVDGNVSLRGSGNVRILINGRPSGLVGISGGSALRQIQADMIERVEVITNPSARYEAEGNAGIINIILKKDKKGGLNGSFSTNLGYPAQYGINGNLNYRKNKMNLFGSYGITYRENFGGGYIDQTYFDDDSISYTYVDRDRDRSGISQNARFGLDYSFNDNTTLTGSFLYRVSDENNIANNTNSFYNSNRELVNKTLRVQDEQEDETVMEYDINFTRKFGESDEHKLTADFQYRNNSETEDSDLRTKKFNQALEQYEDSVVQRSLIDEFSENILMQANYIKPLGEKGSIEAGWRSTLRTITNDYEVTQEVEGQDDIILDDFTNEFIYKEDIHAIYGIYSSEFDKFTYQVGLRAELTDISTEFVNLDTVNARDYLNLFPSLFLTYEFNKYNTLQASYSRRFDRPGFRELNPFSNFNDNRNIRIGNPNLNPEFTDSYEVGLVNNFKNATLYSGLYYRRTTGVIERLDSVTQVTENGVTDFITITQPQNLSERNSIGIENTYSHDLNDWWRMNANLNIYYSETYGVYREKVYQAKTFTMSSRATSQMTFWKELNFQVSAFYRAPQQTTQGTQKAFYMIDLGLSREILNKRGTIAFNVRDLLNSRKWRTTTSIEGYTAESEFQWRARTFNLTFDYRLNSRKSKQGREEGRERDYDGDDF